jgi:hypothetical protein
MRGKGGRERYCEKNEVSGTTKGKRKEIKVIEI